MFVPLTSASCFPFRAVCVAVEIGRDQSVASFGLFESATSASNIRSEVVGVAFADVS